MGTRCGDLDPAIVLYLMDHKNLDSGQINVLFNKQSGLLGLAGIGSSDLRDILAAGEKGNQQAITAINAFVYRIKKYIGAYTAAMGGLNAIVFTAGIGENSALIREMACRGLEALESFWTLKRMPAPTGNHAKFKVIKAGLKLWWSPPTRNGQSPFRRWNYSEHNRSRVQRSTSNLNF